MGINLQDVYDIQGRRKLMYMANNGHKNQAMGTLLRAIQQALIMETGIQGNIFDNNYNNWKHFIEQKTWISKLWRYCTETGIGLKVGKETTFNKRREEDRGLMEIFYKNGHRRK